MYLDGKGVEIDQAEAAGWFLKAAVQGNVDAQFNLGVMYEFGEGIVVNFTEAARWYRKAADQGMRIRKIIWH